MLSILRSDTILPNDGDVRNFELTDIDLGQDTENTYCVGMRFSGGDPVDPASWKVDHVNYWDTVMIMRF